jgi:hypothetical protein
MPLGTQRSPPMVCEGKLRSPQGCVIAAIDCGRKLAACGQFAITAFVPSVATIALSLRRLGEMMKEQKETVGLQNSPGTNQYSGQVIPKPDLPPSLASAGIDKNLAHRIIRINQTINTATIPIAIMVVIQSIAIQPIAKRGNRVRCFSFPQ